MNLICKCPLCDFLLKVINDSTKAHLPGEVKSWASRFKPYFGGREQQDAEELLLELIKYCKNLKQVCSFDTVDMRVCTNCNNATTGTPVEGKRILSCHIDTRNGAYNNTNDIHVIEHFY